LNVLKPHLQTTIWTLLSAWASQREIERVTGIDCRSRRIDVAPDRLSFTLFTQEEFAAAINHALV
jgi:hypothetical protein